MLLSSAPGYFRSRRSALMQAHPDAVFVFPASEEYVRNPDVSFPFRQESNFYYLTGFEEPEAYLVLAGKKTHLFVRSRDPEKEMWEGERYGTDGARKVFGIDEAYPVSDFDQKLPEIMKGSDQVFYRVGMSEHQDRRVLSAIESWRRTHGRSGKALPPISDPNEAVGEMRLYKTADEIELQRKACQLSAAAHKTAMQEVKPGWNEFEVEALIDYVFRKSGCGRVGYPSIVAGGKNAACLHYRSNNEKLRDGDLLLIDAGGEYGYYTADITRTFPIGKRFSAPQAKLYDLVLRAQKETIALARPGAKLPDLHKHSCEVLTDGMLSMGLLKGKLTDLIKDGGKSGDFKRFYPHGTGHWLGMDVHDVGLYLKGGEPRVLEPGMVFTVEPGFYIQPGDPLAQGEYGCIGIRIEDDILITKDGCENLTAGAPKERADIEALR